MLLLNSILIILATSVICKKTVRYRNKIPRIPDTFKDVFAAKPGPQKRPTLGTTKATCWARGGVCVHIRECPDLIMDVSVAGCTDNFRVCCRNFKFGSPTVGILRKPNEIGIYSSDLEELQGESIEVLAQQNIDLLQHIT